MHELTPPPSPRGFYPILDLDLAAARGLEPVPLAAALANLGVRTLQLRAKALPVGAFLVTAATVVAAAGAAMQVIINDRVDVARLAGAAGVHLGQTDLPPAAALPLLPSGAVIGLSTHSATQARAAVQSPAGQYPAVPGYLAMGPVFATASKRNPDPVVGVPTIAEVRSFYSGPLVGIGGISVDCCQAVWKAGADAVAVIGGWMDAPQPLVRAREYMLAFELFCRQSGRERGNRVRG